MIVMNVMAVLTGLLESGMLTIHNWMFEDIVKGIKIIKKSDEGGNLSWGAALGVIVCHLIVANSGGKVSEQTMKEIMFDDHIPMAIGDQATKESVLGTWFLVRLLHPVIGYAFSFIDEDTSEMDQEMGIKDSRLVDSKELEAGVLDFLSRMGWEPDEPMTDFVKALREMIDVEVEEIMKERDGVQLS